MSAAAPSKTLRCCQLATRTQRRSLSSQCLRLSSTPVARFQRRRNDHLQTAKRWQSTDAAAGSSPKIAGIVDQISQLTLLETADLVASLKSRLNIPDMSFAAPMAAGAGAGGAGTAAAAAEAEDDPAPAAEEKSLFTLKLQSFEPTAKPKIIKEVKSMLGLSLVDSKKFVESAPKVLKEGVSKDEGEKIVATLKALGGVVVME